MWPDFLIISDVRDLHDVPCGEVPSGYQTNACGNLLDSIRTQAAEEGGKGEPNSTDDRCRKSRGERLRILPARPARARWPLSSFVVSSLAGEALFHSVSMRAYL